MKNTTRQLVRDLRAAALLGNPEAVDFALDGLLDFPGVSGNDRMSDGFIEKTILPVGQSLSPIKTSHLRPLLNHPLAAGRAIGAVAMAIQYITGDMASAKDLTLAGKDSRQDVRKSLGRALFVVGPKDTKKIFSLGASWLKSEAPRLRFTALIFIPAAADGHGKELIRFLKPLNRDPDLEVRAELVTALNGIANADYGKYIITMLASWAEEIDPNAWVISRVLSAAWVSEYPDQAKLILSELSTKKGTSSQIKSAVEALNRHGVEIGLSEL
jgi:hypothetical protein